MKHTSPKPASQRRLPWWVIPLLVVIAAALLLWSLLSDPVSTKRQVADTPMLMLPPPPPPPPEPEPQPEPEPEEIEPMPEPEPLEEAPTPQEEEAPTPDTADPVTMDADAQAGTDSFGIQRGSGGGSAGVGAGGAGTASYGRYLGFALQQVISRDERVRRYAFQLLLDVWLEPDGAVSRVELVRGSGNEEADSAVLATLRAARVEERPPAALVFPARVLVQGRRPAG